MITFTEHQAFGRTHLVGRIGDVTVCWSIYREDPFEVFTFEVAQAYRGQGIGRQLAMEVGTRLEQIVGRDRNDSLSWIEEKVIDGEGRFAGWLNDETTSFALHITETTQD